MNGILGMTQLLQLTGLNPHKQEMIDTLQSSGTSLLRILNEILDISRIEAGRLDLNPVSIKLSSVIGEALELVRPPHDSEEDPAHRSHRSRNPHSSLWRSLAHQTDCLELPG